jgi:DNA repair protein RadC
MKKIKELLSQERPREKLLEKGAKNLTDFELLAIIILKGNKKENAIELSKKILKQQSIKKLSRKNISSLLKIKGIGQAKACQIKACFEIGKRALQKSNKKIQIKNAKEAAKLLMPEMSNLSKEYFKAVFLDSRRNIINKKTLFIGSRDFSIVHPREIFKTALEEEASFIIITHNHPSGDPKPSKEDKEITKGLKLASEIMQLPLLDHIIIGDNSYYSFQEKGFL